ncbi:MAG: diadenylate cyclase CdaA [Candidatus Azobacteroides pseudotrichonymphae]|jgi:uncharacterized protein (TIGR00159 family)|nr:diadenylate cyclase CdaA [Bacteroidales bacterium OttesenSCG-928-I14]GMO37039.1 MAG: diadenylate cyclase CdaA [Candidatus Azobacteroides pseudotrichonymphae]
MINPKNIKDVVDIILVVFFTYKTYHSIKKTGAITIFTGVLAFVILWILVSQILQMHFMGSILDKFINVGVILLTIVFQKEIREFLQNLGSNRGIKILVKLFKPSSVQNDISYIKSIAGALANLAKRKEGALIAIQQDILLSSFIKTGENIDANINTLLIENIFFKNSPLHDGAIIIAGERIISAACILPVSQNQDIPSSYGLRHRSALGLSEQTDAKIIVISEETGKISLAHKGHLYTDISTEELQEMLIRVSN